MTSLVKIVSKVSDSVSKRIVPVARGMGASWEAWFLFSLALGAVHISRDKLWGEGGQPFYHTATAGKGSEKRKNEQILKIPHNLEFKFPKQRVNL